MAAFLIQITLFILCISYYTTADVVTESQVTSAEEGTKTTIKCKDGSVIQITQAVYKPFKGLDRQSNITRDVAKICDERRKCQVNVTTRNFGDPWPGHLKVANISYHCKPKEPQKRYANEGMKMTLSCKPGWKLKVHFGLYGIFSNETNHKQIRIRDNDCFNTITQWVAGRCANTNNCDIAVNSDHFGDPCPGIHKMAEVYYWCLDD